MGLFKKRPSVDTRSNKSGSVKSPSGLSTHSFDDSQLASTTLLPAVAIPPAPSETSDTVAYLRSIYAVRARSQKILSLAKQNRLNHFHIDSSKFAETAQYVVSIIKRDYAPDYASIPPHGRWQHFDVGGQQRVQELLNSWTPSVDAKEQCRRLLDLFLVSVLLDAGAGSKWQYNLNGRHYNRSEGLAVASLEMFRRGTFSSDPNQPFQVDSNGLSQLSVETLSKGLQVTTENSIEGLEGRTSLLVRLAGALGQKDYFGASARPGNMIDHLLMHPSTQASGSPVVPIPTLWTVLMDGLGPIWPSARTQLQGVSLGDAWPCRAMPSLSDSLADKIVPFHKLTQWLCYSLMVPMTKLLGIRFAGIELMTGLAEYRNGGLFIDTGLITLKPDDARRGLEQYQDNAMKDGQPSIEVVPAFKPDDDVIVEWRALTVGYLDELLIEVNKMLGLYGPSKLSLAQMLEAGSWKAGRELAAVSRPNTRGPPIMLLSDGTVF